MLKLLEADKPMPGVVEVPDQVPIRAAIQDLLLVVQLLAPEEIENRALRLPL